MKKCLLLYGVDWGNERMNFYVLAKCVESEKGDIIIDLDDKMVKFYRPLYKLEEDIEYLLIDGNLKQSHQDKWSKLNSYRFAFGIIKEIDLNDFEFIPIGAKDDIKVDDNGFLYKNDLFVGRLTNLKEVYFLQKEGPDKMTIMLRGNKREGIRLLLKGKKIYRIFTRSKLKILEEAQQYGGNLLDYIAKEYPQEGYRETLKEIEEDIKEAIQLLHNAQKKIMKIKAMEKGNEE